MTQQLFAVGLSLLGILLSLAIIPIARVNETEAQAAKRRHA